MSNKKSVLKSNSRKQREYDMWTRFIEEQARVQENRRRIWDKILGWSFLTTVFGLFIFLGLYGRSL